MGIILTAVIILGIIALLWFIGDVVGGILWMHQHGMHDDHADAEVPDIVTEVAGEEDND